MRRGVLGAMRSAHCGVRMWARPRPPVRLQDACLPNVSIVNVNIHHNMIMIRKAVVQYKNVGRRYCDCIAMAKKRSCGGIRCRIRCKRACRTRTDDAVRIVQLGVSPARLHIAHRKKPFVNNPLGRMISRNHSMGF